MPIRTRLILVASLLLVASAAVASNLFRAKLTVTSTTGRYCAGYRGAPISYQCDYAVRAAYGAKLTDGGTKRSSDAGAPIVADTNDELVNFPGDPYEVTLGPAEQCVGLLSADGGTNLCSVFEKTAP